MKVFFDTSAFAKRYVSEQGSDKVSSLCQQADSIIVSIICLPELISTLSRLVRETKIDDAQYLILKSNILTDLRDVDVCQLTPAVLNSVISLLESNQLRAMDAIHVACAQSVKADVFVSSDHRQLAAAQNTGLIVIDVS